MNVARIPVRVDMSFLATSLIVGLSGDIFGSMLWCMVSFVSVLAHELGHAFVGRMFGLAPAIHLHAMGGTTSFRGTNPNAAWKRILISLAGPFAGFLLGGAVIGTVLAVGDESVHGYLRTACAMAIWINIGWGLVNLLPALPLDGGHVMTEIAFKLFGARARRGVHIFSALVIAAVGTWALLRGMTGAVVIALMVLGHNLLALRVVPQKRDEAAVPQEDPVPTLEQVDAACAQGDGARAIELAKTRMAAMRGPDDRGRAALALTRAYLAAGQPARAKVVLDTMVPEPLRDADLADRIARESTA